MARGYKKNRDYESGYKNETDLTDDNGFNEEEPVHEEINDFNAWETKETEKKEEPKPKPNKKKPKKDNSNISVIDGYEAIRSVDIKNILDAYIASNGNIKSFNEIVKRLGYFNVKIDLRQNEINIEWNGKKYKFFKLN